MAAWWSPKPQMGVRLFLLLQHSGGEVVNVSVRKTDIRGFESLSEVNASLAQLAERLPCKQQVAGSIPVGGSEKSCKFAPAKPLLDMAQTFIFTTCWRSSSIFAGCAVSGNSNRHHERFSNFRSHRS